MFSLPWSFVWGLRCQQCSLLVSFSRWLVNELGPIYISSIDQWCIEFFAERLSQLHYSTIASYFHPCQIAYLLSLGQKIVLKPKTCLSSCRYRKTTLGQENPRIFFIWCSPLTSRRMNLTASLTDQVHSPSLEVKREHHQPDLKDLIFESELLIGLESFKPG